MIYKNLVPGKKLSFLKFPISLGLFFGENNMVKLFIGHAVCERITAVYGELLLK